MHGPLGSSGRAASARDRLDEALGTTAIDVVVISEIADQFCDIGHQVGYSGPPHATVNARPGDLHRAVTNLVDNAVRFASDITIKLSVAAESVTH